MPPATSSSVRRRRRTATTIAVRYLPTAARDEHALWPGGPAGSAGRGRYRQLAPVGLSIMRHWRRVRPRPGSSARRTSAPKATIAGASHPRQPVLALWRGRLRRHAGRRRFGQQPHPALGCGAMTGAEIAVRDPGPRACAGRRLSPHRLAPRPRLWACAARFSTTARACWSAPVARPQRSKPSWRRLRRRPAAPGANRAHRDPSLRRGPGRGLSYPRQRVRPGAHRDRPRRRDLCAACAAEMLDPVRAPLPLPLHQLHPLRPAPLHRPEPALRPGDDHDGPFAMCAGLPRRVRGPRRPALPRRSRSPATPAGRGRRSCVSTAARSAFDQHSMLDDVDAAGTLLRKGQIVAIKGLGGYQLACDATSHEAVGRAAPAQAPRAQSRSR